MKSKKQAGQEKGLPATEKRHRKDKEGLGAIRLMPEGKLAGREKKRIAAAMKKAKRDGKIPQSAQETIPYREMRRDGICDVDGHYFTKQVEFLDINYQLGATRSHTNTILQGKKLCGRLDHVVLKMGGFLQSMEATTYALMSGMMG